MKIPQLSKKSETKSCHNVTWTDDYSWVHQKNILEVLKDSSKLLPEVRKYLDIFREQPYIFNLGHGVLPETKPEIIKFVTSLVRKYK